MPKTDIKFLEDRMSMMETEGWHDLIEDFKILEDSASNINSMNSEQDLWYAKGQLLVVNLILSLHSATTLALEESDNQNPT